MRSQLLYTTEEGYSGPLDTAVLFDGASVQALGHGYGSVAWSGKAGRIEWNNFPSRRPDGVFLPDLTGSIELEGHERKVLFRFQGISLEPDADGRRLFAGPIRWFTDDPDLLWLNDRWGYVEGEIEVASGSIRTAVHVLQPDPPD